VAQLDKGCASHSALLAAAWAKAVRTTRHPTACLIMLLLLPRTLRVVLTVMLPSTRFSSQPTPTSFRARVTAGHTSRRYFSAVQQYKQHVQALVLQLLVHPADAMAPRLCSAAAALMLK
jgi:hypothetical protein